MKKILIAISCGAALFFEGCSGCKEVPPVINFGGARSVDTTYVLSTIPASQSHNVLVEDFTGESCSNCPTAHDQLDAIGLANLGRLNVISMYDTGYGVLVPPGGAHFDLRNAAAATIFRSIIYTTNQEANYGQFPGGGVDRMPIPPGATTYLAASAWNGAITSRLSAPDSLNLDISSTYSGGVATIVAKITYTQAVSSHQSLTIAVVEDSIVDFQEMPFPAGVDTAYVFKDVLVGMATPLAFGDPILDTMATKEAGRFVQKTYSYTLPTSFRKGLVNPARCRVIAFVHRPSNTDAHFEVLQSQQTKLMGP